MPAPSLIAATDTFNDWFNATNNLISFVSNTSQVLQVDGIANGNTSINGTMTVSNLAVNTSANVVGSLFTTTAVTIPSPTTISGNVVISSADLSVGRNLFVTSNTSVGRDFSVGGNANVTGNVAVSSAVYVGSNVTVGLSSIFMGNSTANTVRTSTSFVVANSTSTATLTPTSLTIGTQVFNTTGISVTTLGVTGATNVLSTLGVTGAVNALSTLGVTGATNVLSTLGVTGAVNALSTLGVTGAVNALGALGVTGAVNALGALGVTGAVNALSTLGVTGAVNALSTLGVTGAVNALSTLGVTSVASFNGNTIFNANVTANVSTISITRSDATSTALVIEQANSTVFTGGSALNGKYSLASRSNAAGEFVIYSWGGAKDVLTINAAGGAILSGAVNVLSTLGVTGVLSVTANAAFKTNVLLVDAVNNRVGVNNSAPTQALTVTGTTQSTRVTTDVVTLTDGASVSLDASAGSVFKLSASGNRTISAPTNPVDGQKIIIKHYANGADRTLALASGTGGFAFGTDITALTATTNGKSDYIGCIYDGTPNKWYVVAYVKGY